MLKHTSKLIATVTTATLLSSCGSESSTRTTEYSGLNQALSQVITLVVEPAATNFLNQARQLDSLSDAFCSTTTEANLLAVQNQWRATAKSWYELLPYNFGPMINDEVLPEYIFIDSLRLRGTNYTQTVRNDIDSMLAASSALTDTMFTNKNFQFVGLLATELAVFERASDHNTEIGNILSDFTTQSRKCQILQGYTGQLVTRAENISNGWSSNYQNTGSSYRNLLLSGDLNQIAGEDSSSTSAKLITSTNEYMDYVHKRTIINDVAVVSGYTWNLMLAGLESFERMVEGSAAGTTESFANILEKNAANDLTVIRNNITTTKTAIGEQNATNFYAATLALDGNIKRELKDGLGIDVGLNFSDGD